MISKSRRPFVVKCGFLVLLIACSSVLIFLFCWSVEEDTSLEAKFEDDLSYSPKPLLPFSKEILDENFEKCLFHLLLSNFGGAKSQGNILFPQLAKFNKTTKAKKIKNYPMFAIIKMFTDLMLSFLRIETVLIEPSILFCMLSRQYKDLLIKRKFHFKNFSKTMQVVTFGVRGADIIELEKSDVRGKIAANDFGMQIVKEPLLEWMKTENAISSKNEFISHVFFQNEDWIIHLVPFYKRGNFLWHSSLTIESNGEIPYEELYFSESDAAYENFTYESLGFKDDSLNNINIPSNAHYFLFETMSSRFSECNQTIVSTYFKTNLTGIPNKHSSLSVDHFNNRAIVGLQELKHLFYPLLMHFWIWSGTMLGWYRQCGVIPYTSDVDFGAWASEVDDLDELIKRFDKSDHLELKQRMGIIETGLEFNINCHRLRVDVFFLYDQSNGTWYAGHRPSKGYYFKYHHPNFSLCSADLLGHKVLVPCDTEKVIVAEYGSKWMTPVTSWNYESSIQNRGPNIYWDKDMLKKVYLDT